MNPTPSQPANNIATQGRHSSMFFYSLTQAWSFSFWKMLMVVVLSKASFLTSFKLHRMIVSYVFLLPLLAVLQPSVTSSYVCGSPDMWILFLMGEWGGELHVSWFQMCSTLYQFTKLHTLESRELFTHQPQWLLVSKLPSLYQAFCLYDSVCMLIINGFPEEDRQPHAECCYCALSILTCSWG